MSLQDTPRASRLHIGIFGKRNSGKSSILNALTGQDIAVTSDTPGTTTDPVYKSMEIHGLGPVVWIDTAGYDDVGDLGALRVEKTAEALAKTDIALLLLGEMPDATDKVWMSRLKASHTPIIPVVSKMDILPSEEVKRRLEAAEGMVGVPALAISSKDGTGIEALRNRLIRALPEDFEPVSILGDLVTAGDSVLLVMPQDIQAPKGRLILPQVQTLRELLDRKCTATCCTTDRLEATLAALKMPPKLIITDSQVFRTVYDLKPAESALTSFSVLMAGYKGDLKTFVEGAAAVDGLTATSRVLIAEACTHAPMSEDIGRVKIPAMLKKRFGADLQVDVVSGVDFPADLTPYDLIIHCGGCMFNRKYVLSRIEKAREQRVPITNYGVVIAYLNGILKDVVMP
ncbi:MAG: [FeFe] hydrogenase H-cluster maturation GTPase HydF [Clostridia bacterium]|nr:[FeFe] hydrogenase H-cluster maturation GTPase HydF [Clostridia bacterium]